MLWLTKPLRLITLWIGHLWFRLGLAVKNTFARLKTALARGSQRAVHCLAAPFKRLAAGVGAGAAFALLVALLVLAPLGWAIRFLFRETTGTLTELWNDLNSPQEIAWPLVAFTGTVGLLLLLFLHWVGLSSPTTAATVDRAAPPATPARETVRPVPESIKPEPTIQEADPQPTPAAAPDPSREIAYRTLPNPFAPVEPVDSEPPVDRAPPVDSKPVEIKPVELEQVAQEVEAPQPASPQLTAQLTPTELPSGVSQFALPLFDKSFHVAPTATKPVEPPHLPADDWTIAFAPRRSVAEPAIPAPYHRQDLARDRSPAPPAPRREENSLLPAAREVSITIEKSLPQQAPAGQLLWYDLIVTNRGTHHLAHLVVEERVLNGHRVAEAYPAASLDEDVLSWRIAGLEAGESRTLHVGVYPSSDKPIETVATIRPRATYSAATLVEAADPAIYRQIKLAMITPERLVQGAGYQIELVVTNTGTVPLSGVTVSGTISEDSQRSGQVKNPFDASLGRLVPGETGRAWWSVAGEKIGTTRLTARVTATEGVATRVAGSFEIVESLEGAVETVAGRDAAGEND